MFAAVHAIVAINLCLDFRHTLATFEHLKFAETVIHVTLFPYSSKILDHPTNDCNKETDSFYVTFAVPSSVNRDWRVTRKIVAASLFLATKVSSMA